MTAGFVARQPEDPRIKKTQCFCLSDRESHDQGSDGCVYRAIARGQYVTVDVAAARQLAEAGRLEVSEDRRIANLMREPKNRAVLERRAQVTEALCDELVRVSGELERARVALRRNSGCLAGQRGCICAAECMGDRDLYPYCRACHDTRSAAVTDDYEADSYSDLVSEISDGFMGESGELYREHASAVLELRRLRVELVQARTELVRVSGELADTRTENARLLRAVTLDAPYCQTCDGTDPEQPLCDSCMRWVRDESYPGIEAKLNAAVAALDRVKALCAAEQDKYGPESTTKLGREFAMVSVVDVLRAVAALERKDR